jgi:3-hydroxybutyryl-CoA dehydrogenase
MTAAETSDITRVGLVGAGVMGAGIAEVCARSGLSVTVAVSGPASADRGRTRVRGSLDRAVARGRLDAGERDAAWDRITFTTDLADLADRQLVVEAITEDEAAKLEVFRELDRVVTDDDAILASNTSSIPVMKLARATGRSPHVLGMHFFNPVPALPLVELTGSLLTAEATRSRAERFVADTLGKQPIKVGDRSGFVVNALLIPYLLAAIRMVESGYATPEVIDKGMVLGCSHPLGPLALADLIGLDVVAAIADALHEEYREPQYVRPPLLSRMVEGGLRGRKTGAGFYTYA